MIIGIDVDGVLVDMGSYQLEMGKPYFKSKYGYEIKNPKAYDVETIFGCSHKEREKFWTKYIWRYCLKLEMATDAAKVVRILREAGHKIFVITGRAHTTEKGITGVVFRRMLVYWLRKNHFEYDRIIYVSEKNSASDKHDVCLNEKVDILVDDKPENILLLKDKITVLCYPAVWNEDMQELDPYRISGFGDLLTYIDT